MCMLWSRSNKAEFLQWLAIWIHLYFKSRSECKKSKIEVLSFEIVELQSTWLYNHGKVKVLDKVYSVAFYRNISGNTELVEVDYKKEIIGGNKKLYSDLMLLAQASLGSNASINECIKWLQSNQY